MQFEKINGQRWELISLVHWLADAIYGVPTIIHDSRRDSIMQLALDAVYRAPPTNNPSVSIKSFISQYVTTAIFMCGDISLPDAIQMINHAYIPVLPLSDKLKLLRIDERISLKHQPD